jgi:hypothetical protein
MMMRARRLMKPFLHNYCSYDVYAMKCLLIETIRVLVSEPQCQCDGVFQSRSKDMTNEEKLGQWSHSRYQFGEACTSK